MDRSDVCETVIIALVIGTLQTVSFGGYLYERSDWLTESSQRLDLYFFEACLLTMNLVVALLFLTPKLAVDQSSERFKPVVQVWGVLFLLLGLHFAVALGIWFFETRTQPELWKKHLIGFCFYSFVAVGFTVIGWMLMCLIGNDFLRIRRDRKAVLFLRDNWSTLHLEDPFAEENQRVFVRLLNQNYGGAAAPIGVYHLKRMLLHEVLVLGVQGWEKTDSPS